MKIAGLQKVTLIDYPKKIACTIFLYGCNFKCGFCHNPELVINPIENEISKQEILEFLDKRKKYLEGVCITGGEPLLSLGKDFLKDIKRMGYLVKLDTNGSFPEKLKELIDEKLIDFVAMDIKSGSEKYSEVADAFVDLKKIEESIKLISGSGLDYEFRTTVVPGIHDVWEMQKIAKWLNSITNSRPKKYVLQGFKNQGKFINQKYGLEINIGENFLKELKKEIKDYFEDVEIRV